MSTTQPVVLVTGASSGIGLATARRFVSQGYRVFGTSRNPRRLPPVEGVTFVALDVTDDTSVTDAVAAVVDQGGRLDVLVNNAGALLVGGAEESSVAQVQQLFDTNFFGVVRMTNAVLPHMRARGTGRIVTVGSLVGFVPTPYNVFYSSSKYALEGYAQGLDHELREFGIRSVLVEPGYTNTAIDATLWMGDSPIEAYEARRVQARTAMADNISGADSPDSIASVVVKAASATSPKLRYPAGATSRLMTRMVRVAPAGLLDSAIRRTAKLNQPAPAATTQQVRA
ncbi:oxidoreductase [Williamsia sp. M5A3_1d]